MPESTTTIWSQVRTIQHRPEPSRALRSCHINARVARTILKRQESSRTSQNHHAVSKSRQISKNQSTGHASIYHYNISHARTIQHRTEPSRALTTCHIHARVAKTILKRQESSRTSHNHHAVSKSRQISRNQSTGHARIYHHIISQARTIQHRTDPLRALRTCHNHARVANNLSWNGKKHLELAITIDAASKSRQISKNQCTGHATIYHYQYKSQAKNHLQHVHRYSSRAQNATCHIYAKTSHNLSSKGKNTQKLAITIKQYLNQGRSPEINPQVRPAIYHFNISNARTIQHGTEPSRALRTCHIHARLALTILEWQESSRT